MGRLLLERATDRLTDCRDRKEEVENGMFGHVEIGSIS